MHVDSIHLIKTLFIAIVTAAAVAWFIFKATRNKKKMTAHLAERYPDLDPKNCLYSQLRDMLIASTADGYLVACLEKGGVIEKRYSHEKLKKAELYINDYLAGSLTSGFDIKAAQTLWAQGPRGQIDPSIYVKFDFEDGPIFGQKIYVLESRKVAKVDSSPGLILASTVDRLQIWFGAGGIGTG